MKTTKEKIEVMQAYVDSKQIQVWLSTTGWTDIVREPCWEWSDCDYRIKPEPKPPTYRPYESVEEMVEDFEKRFQPKPYSQRPMYTMPLIWVRYKESRATKLYGYLINDSLELKADFRRLEYLDGTPFGKLVEE